MVDIYVEIIKIVEICRKCMENYRKCRGTMENMKKKIIEICRKCIENFRKYLENYRKCMENYEKCMENVEKLREIMENYGKCMEIYCLGILDKNLHVFIALLKLYCLGWIVY